MGYRKAASFARMPLLLDRVRGHLGYTFRLLDGRTSLAEHRRLLASAGWLSLLAATCLIDVDRGPAGMAHLRVAAQLGGEAGNDEIRGWALETQAWHTLTAGDYRRAVDLSRQAQIVAPPGSSPFIRATAQEGRAWARLGAGPEAYDALARTEAMAARLPQPDLAEHHYRYDPAKSQAYVATTLSWLSDPAAESYARLVLGRLEDGSDGQRRPRRGASARLDLGLALASTGQLDEAASIALAAVTSGLLVPSKLLAGRGSHDGYRRPRSAGGRGPGRCLPRALPAGSARFVSAQPAGRYSLVVIIAEGEEAFVVTAREMTTAEKKTFRRKAR